MTPASQIERDADQVRRSIGQDVKAAGSMLAEFSRRYALAPEHRNAALAIKVSIAETEDASAAASLRQRMADLVDRIVAGQTLENTDLSRQLEARQRLFAQLRSDPPRRETICRSDKLEKRFPSTGFALGPVSFELRAGEITALVGQNAHGKTTFLRTLIGEHRPSGGEVTFPALSPGSSVRWTNVRQHIGYLPQKLPNWMGSLENNLYFHAALRGLSPAESETQIRYLMARLDLVPHLDKRWNELSGGLQLRFALARALTGKPRLLVLDEPLANLDPPARAALLWDIRQLSNAVHRTMAVLISSQVLDALEAVTDNIVFLRNGRVVYQGPKEGIGRDRTSNLYECDTSLSLGALVERIGPHVQDIRHNGVYYIIRTPLTLSYVDLLQLLIRTGVEFTHCRDIGRRALGMFEQN